MNMAAVQLTHSNLNLRTSNFQFLIATRPKLIATQLAENKRRRPFQIATRFDFLEELAKAKDGTLVAETTGPERGPRPPRGGVKA